MNPSRGSATVWAIIVAASAARAWHLDALSLWFDEGWSAFAASRAPALVAGADPTNPPLYYWLLHLLVQGGGTSELALRWASVLMGAAGIALAYALGTQVAGERAGRYAAALVGLSPILWWASREARMYSLLAAFATLAALGWLWTQQRASPRAWAALLAGELGVLWSHHSGPVFVLALNAAMAAAWLGRRRATGPGWRPWLAAQAAVLILWAPARLAAFLGLGAANAAVTAGPTVDVALVVHAWEALWAGSWAIVGHEPLLLGLAGLMAVLVAFLLPWRCRQARQLALLWALTVGGTVAALVLLGNPLHGRYLVMAAPLILVPLGAGIAGLRRPVVRLAALAPSLVAVLAVAQLTVSRTAYGNDDARGLALALRERLGPADSLVAWSYADRYDLGYYWDRERVPGRRITLPEGADMAEVVGRLPRSGSVAQNVWYGQRADYRGMLGCLLAHGSTRPPEPVEVPGMTTFLFDAAPTVAPSLRPVGAPLDGGTVRAAGRLPRWPADRALCLPVQLQLETPLGQEIAHVDASALDADQRGSRQVTELAAFPLVRLPYGTSPGDYEVVLRPYLQDSAGSTSAAGPDVALGTWRIVPGAAWSPESSDIGLPRVERRPLGPDLFLVADDAGEHSDEPLRPGTVRPVTLLWSGQGPLPTLMLRYDDGRRTAFVPATAPPIHDAITREWRGLRLPLDAPDGEATLELPDGRVIGRYPVRGLPPPLTALPALTDRVDQGFSDPLKLVGDVRPAAIAPDDGALDVTLVWRGGRLPTATSLVAFVQLLGPDGRVVAQHDGLPAGGERPTTSWRPDELIVDGHRLDLPAELPVGPLALIAGLYDPATGARLQTDGGADHVLLAEHLGGR